MSTITGSEYRAIQAVPKNGGRIRAIEVSTSSSNEPGYSYRVMVQVAIHYTHATQNFTVAVTDQGEFLQ